MNIQEYDKCVEQLTQDRKKVSKGKRDDYTRGSEDVLANFKNQAEALGVDPKVSLAVHMEKQFSAVLNYIKTDGESESEPIIKRIGDTINYLELLWGLINEENSVLVLDCVEGIDTDKLRKEWMKKGTLLPCRKEADEMYPYTPDDAFFDKEKLHKTKIKTLSFRLRTDVRNIGAKGWTIKTSKPSKFEYIDEHGEHTVLNLFEDERFELVD